MDRYRRVHRDRYLRTWTRDGALCGSFSLTPDELARMCRSHHRLKTVDGWRLIGPPGDWQWLPPERE